MASPSNAACDGLNQILVIAAVQRAIGPEGIRQDSDMTEWLAIAVWRSLMYKVKQLTDTSGGRQPDWRSEVLQPAVATFPEPWQLLGPNDDIEYALLVCCNIFLAYDILRYRFDKITMHDEGFILGAFEEMLSCRAIQDLRDNIVDVLLHEHERLVAQSADTATVRAAYMTQALLTGACQRNLVRAKYTYENQLLPFITPGNQFDPLPPSCMFSTDASLVRQLGPSTDDVYVQFFLTKDSMLQFPCVRSATFRDGVLVVDTYIGLRMRVEASMWVAGILQRDDSISVHGTDPEGPPLSATITVPPGFYYESSDIVSLGDMFQSCKNDESAMEITTAVGKVKIYRMRSGPFIYCVVGKRLIIKNTVA